MSTAPQDRSWEEGKWVWDADKKTNTLTVSDSNNPNLWISYATNKSKTPTLTGLVGTSYTISVTKEQTSITLQRTDVDVFDTVVLKGVELDATKMAFEIGYLSKDANWRGGEWPNTSDLVTYGNIQFTITSRSVPEPATGSLSLLALAGLCIRRRKQGAKDFQVAVFLFCFLVFVKTKGGLPGAIRAAFFFPPPVAEVLGKIPVTQL